MTAQAHQLEGQHPFVENFTARLDADRPLASGAAPGWLTTLKARSRQRLDTISVPGPRDEEWRLLRLRPLTQTQFGATPEGRVTAAQIAPYRIEEAAQTTLVFVNGRFAPELSRVEGLPDGVTVTTWKELVESGKADAISEHAGANTWFAHDLFYELNTAAFDDGAVILVPRNQVVEQPVHLLHVATEAGEAFAVHPRHLIVAGESSQVTVVEEYVGLADTPYLNNVVAEVHVGANAHVEHFKVQQDNVHSFHFARNLVNCAADSRYHSAAITFGARLSRNDSHALFEGSNIDCTLDGLAYVTGQQVADTHSALDHAKPHSRSYQLHKCIVDGNAHTIFNGKIFVRKDAQKTSSNQLNQNLLLSKRGTVDTKPQLEILADDVVCSHGATVGQLEDEQHFYLTSRGLDPVSARNLLTYAFAAEIVETMTVDSLKERLEQFILERAEG